MRLLRGLPILGLYDSPREYILLAVKEFSARRYKARNEVLCSYQRDPN